MSTLRDEVPGPPSKAVEALVASALFAVYTAMAAYAISEMCFDNLGDVATASPESERGSWCEAIAGSSAWELKLIGAGIVFGGLVALLPARWQLRAGLLAAGGFALLLVTVYMGTLEHIVPV